MSSHKSVSMESGGVWPLELSVSGTLTGISVSMSQARKTMVIIVDNTLSLIERRYTRANDQFCVSLFFLLNTKFNYIENILRRLLGSIEIMSFYVNSA